MHKNMYNMLQNMSIHAMICKICKISKQKCKIICKKKYAEKYAKKIAKYSEYAKKYAKIYLQNIWVK